jgi:hypothetical protein
MFVFIVAWTLVLTIDHHVRDHSREAAFSPGGCADVLDPAASF